MTAACHAGNMITASPWKPNNARGGQPGSAVGGLRVALIPHATWITVLSGLVLVIFGVGRLRPTLKVTLWRLQCTRFGLWFSTTTAKKNTELPTAVWSMPKLTS